jgi:hypothetical protein
MWSLASLVLAFCLCASSQIFTDESLEDWTWLKARYEDKEDTYIKHFEIFERNRIGVYASANFNLFFPGEDEVYVGFS